MSDGELQQELVIDEEEELPCTQPAASTVEEEEDDDETEDRHSKKIPSTYLQKRKIDYQDFESAVKRFEKTHFTEPVIKPQRKPVIRQTKKPITTKKVTSTTALALQQQQRPVSQLKELLHAYEDISGHRFLAPDLPPSSTAAAVRLDLDHVFHSLVGSEDSKSITYVDNFVCKEDNVVTLRSNTERKGTYMIELKTWTFNDYVEIGRAHV